MARFRRASAVCLLATSGISATSKTSDTRTALKELGACFDLVSFHAKHHAKEVRKIIRVEAKEVSEEDLTSEAAWNSLILRWMAKCHDGIETVGMKNVIAASLENVTLYEQLEHRLLGSALDKQPHIHSSTIVEVMAFVMSQPKKLLALKQEVLEAPGTSDDEFVIGLFGEKVTKSTDQYHKAVLLLCVLTAILSVGFKFLQRRRHDVGANAEVKQVQDYIAQMIVAFEDEFAVIGGTSLVIMFSRQNAVMGALLNLLCSPTGVSRGHIQDILDGINLLIAMTLFYFLLLHAILMFFAFRQLRRWEAEERQCMQGVSNSETGSASEYERLRYAFLFPMYPGAGIGRSKTHIESQNINFSMYLDVAVTAFIKEMVFLPLYTFILPIALAVVLYPIWTLITGGRQDSNNVANLYLANGLSWGLLFVALLMHLDTRRIYSRILPPNLGDPAPMYGKIPPHQETHGRNYAMLRSRPSEEMQGADRDAEALSMSRANSLAETENATPGCCVDKQVHVQHRLFWGGRSGARRLTRTFQLLIFHCATIPAVYDLLFSWRLKWEYPVGFALFCLPAPLLMLIFIDTLKRAVLCMRLELMADPDLLEHVTKETRQVRYAMVDSATTTARLVRQLKYETVRHRYTTLRETGKIREELTALREKFESQPLAQIELTYARGVFHRFDLNGDGWLDRRELMDWLDGEGLEKHYTSERTVGEWISIFDINQDGRLDMNEFLVLHRCLMQEVRTATVTHEACHWICQNLDKDENGYLDANEFAQALSHWMDVPVKPGDVEGIWQQVQPRALQLGYIEIPLIAEWLYEMVQTHDQAHKLEMAAVQRIKTLTRDFDREGTEPRNLKGKLARRGSGWNLET